MSSRRARAASWVAVAAAGVLLSYGLGLLRVPAPPLFAGVLVGLAVALSGRVRFGLPGPVGPVAFAVIGVVIGQILTLAVLRAVAADAPAVAAALVTTLVLSVVTGYGLAAATRMDRPTAVFGMLAGGAAGVVAVSDEVGADSPLVALMQYLRVLVVIASIPLVSGLLAAGATKGGGTAPATGPLAAGVAFTAVVGAVGAGLGRLARLQSATLLGPLILAAAVAIAAPDLVAPVPGLLQDVAFLVVGLQVGLRFSLERLRLAARSLPAILVAIAALMLACAGIAAGLAAWTGRPYVDCYLATTPGGLNAVLPAAVRSDSDAAFVTSVQVLRVLLMLLAAPALGRLVRRRR